MPRQPGPSSLLDRSDSRRFTALSAPRSPGAGPPVSHDTGRAAVGRAGSFNSVGDCDLNLWKEPSREGLRLLYILYKLYMLYKVFCCFKLT